VAVQAYRRWGADRIIAETNNGGDMVEAVIRSVDRSVSYRKVTATRGKVIRAEPIAALYEQGRAHHVGGFDRLEDQMIEFDPTIAQTKSPDRMDALVWAGTELFGGVSRVGSVSELRL
jgi:phage terminase large subunit-like protein